MNHEPQYGDAARLAAIVASSSDAIYSRDLDGDITTWNAAAERLYGYPAAEVLGRPISLLIPDEGRREEDAAIARVLTGEPVVEFDTTRIAKGGDRVNVLLTLSPIRDADGVITGISKIGRDIQPLKEANAKLQETIAELRTARDFAEAASVAKDRFLAALSHELRTPLAPILATLSYVERMADVPTLLRDEIVTIRRNVETEARLIDDLLDVTRISRGKLELRREIVDVHAVVRAALAVCQSEAEAKGIAVTTMLRAKRFYASVDAARLQQVFWNLIKNAVKFTPVDGTITLKSSNAADGTLAVEVADTGQGIDEATMPWVFHAFEQPVKRPLGGLGLGLTIAKTLVDYHGGTITAASTGPDQGATFTVTIMTISPPTVRPDLLVSPGGWPSPKILFVEDNPDTLRAFDRVLTSAGFAVTPATSVREALHAAASTRFDLLVCDIGLPDGDGKDVMREVRVKYGLRGIAFSGYGSDDDARASQEAGFSHHQSKPVRAEVMVDLVRQALGNPAA